MPLKTLTDDAGDTIAVLEVDEFHYPAFSVPNLEDEMRSMPTWKARDDDVLLCAYPKSGELIFNFKLHALMQSF